METRMMLYTKRADFQKIAEEFGIDQVTARIIRNRDVVGEEQIRNYLSGRLSDLPEASLLPDIEKAASLLHRLIREGRHIRIVGDYDIDGVCATYILQKGLLRVQEALQDVPEEGEKGKASCALIDHVIPDRIRDGYGINLQIIEAAVSDGVEAVLTCDNGIAALEELREAKERGLKVIVTDHHEVRLDPAGEEQLPPADAIVNPKLSKSAYPEKNICGAVVAWRLLERLYEKTGIPRREWEAFLEFAAVATVGDVMELQGGNRIIVREGLRRMNAGCENPGLAKLVEVCGLTGKRLTAYHIGFVIGPCINAGGRLESAETALQLFLCGSPENSLPLALHLQELNEERKAMTEQGVEEAARQAESLYPEDQVLVLFLPKLHESLAGIVAGRIREKYGKPCFVLTEGAEAVKGSGRSIEAYHMFQGLCGVSELLEKFGGHPMAAGLSLRRENLEAFRRELNRQAGLSPEDFRKTVWIDAAMPVSYVTERLVQELALLEPFGPGNEKPVFAEKAVRLRDLRVIGKNRNVLRCRVLDGAGPGVDGILFGEADRMREELSAMDQVNILYYPEINEYNGIRRLQIVISEYFS